MNYLIIGGASVAGRAAARAIRELDADARIYATSSRTDSIASADHTITEIDVAETDAVDRLIAAAAELRLTPENLKAMIYVPARGEVGLPAHKATAEQVQKAIDYSLRPLVRLTAALRPQRSICISGFITMQPLLECYGAMAFAKIAMEELVVRHPHLFKVIRFGMFHSNSVRGIALLVQRNMMRNVHPEFEVLKSEWKQSGRRFPDYFYDKNYRYESDTYAHISDLPFRPTEEKDLETGFRLALGDTADPIINVLGDWVWSENSMPPLPDVITDNRHLMPDDLDALLTGTEK